MSVEAEVKAGAEVESRVGHDLDVEGSARSVGHRERQGPTAESAVRGVVVELRMNHVHAFEPAVGMLDPAHHHLVLVSGPCGEPEVEEDAVAGAVDTFHEYRRPH